MKEIITKIDIDKKFQYSINLKTGEIEKRNYAFWRAKEFKLVILMIILGLCYYGVIYSGNIGQKCINMINNETSMKELCYNFSLYLGSQNTLSNNQLKLPDNFYIPNG